MRIPYLVLLLLVAWPAAAQEDFRVMKLEQDVRNLERIVQDLGRQISDVKLQMAIATGPTSSRPPAAASTAEAWLHADNWKRVQPGMAEADVVRILGAPTSARSEEGARVLFYAMDIGVSGVLGGRVTLREGRVASVTAPQLQ